LGKHTRTTGKVGTSTTDWIAQHMKNGVQEGLKVDVKGDQKVVKEQSPPKTTNN